METYDNFFALEVVDVSLIFFSQVIAITVEDEEDIAKFKDYKPASSNTGAASAAESPASSPPKKEVVEEPVRSPEPKTVKQSPPPPAGERIFASPLARKLAEENNVRCKISFSINIWNLMLAISFQLYFEFCEHRCPFQVSKEQVLMGAL